MSEIAKVGDRVRSKAYPGVSGIVTRLEHTNDRGLIYHTSKGFWEQDTVTVEPQSPPNGRGE